VRSLYVCHAPFTEWVAKVIGISGHWVTSMPRSAFEGLEPCDGNLSRTVLRRLGVSNDPRLPGLE
jgi:hypothetical protein